MTYTLLIVDDTEALAQAIADMLRMEGFRVIHSFNGVEALAVLEREKIDLIISDLLMPGMNGIEFIQQVRRIESLRDIPVIVISAQANEASKQESEQAGADLFLVKPFDEQEFISAINQFLE